MSDTIRWCFTHETRWYDDPCGGSEHDDDCDVALLVRADQPVYRTNFGATDDGSAEVGSDRSRDMNTEQAITIVGKQLVANAAREIQWEDIPDIGEQDFMWLMNVLLELSPEEPEFDKAITMLEERAAAWTAREGAET